MNFYNVAYNVDNIHSADLRALRFQFHSLLNIVLKLKLQFNLYYPIDILRGFQVQNRLKLPAIPHWVYCGLAIGLNLNFLKIV